MSRHNRCLSEIHSFSFSPVKQESSVESSEMFSSVATAWLSATLKGIINGNLNSDRDMQMRTRNIHSYTRPPTWFTSRRAWRGCTEVQWVIRLELNNIELFIVVVSFDQQTCQTSFTNGNSHVTNREIPNSLRGSLKTVPTTETKRNSCSIST